MGKKVSLYFQNWDLLNKLSDEEDFELKGSSLEEFVIKSLICCRLELRGPLLSYYSGEIGLHEMLLELNQRLEYSSEFRSEKNLTFVQTVHHILQFCNWKTSDFRYGDYDSRYAKREIRDFTNLFAKIAEELERKIELCETEYYKQNDLKPWDLPKTYTSAICQNPDSYNSDFIEELKRKTLLYSSIADSMTPMQVVGMIIENWDLVWELKSTYEVLACCIILSEESKLSDEYVKEIRRFLNETWPEKK